MRFIVFLCLSFVLLFGACKRTKIEVNLAQIQGSWVRLASDKPDYDGMKILVSIDSNQQGQGIVTRLVDSNAYFELGQYLWTQIQPDVDSSYSAQIRGSDGNYYAASLTLEQKTDGFYLQVQVSSDYDTYGQIQTWYQE